MKLKKTRIRNSCCIALACIFGVSGCAGVSKTMKETFASDDPCANSSRNMGVLLGTVAGVGLGAVVQKMTGMKISRLGLLIGGATGALAGGLIGSDMDRRRCELSKIAQKHNLKMTVSEVLVPASDSDTPSEPGQKDQKEERADLSVPAQDADGGGRSPSGSGEVVPAQPGQKGQKEEKAGLSVSVQDADGGGHFSSGSDKLLPKAQGYFREIAEQYVLDKQVKLPPDASSEKRKAVEELNNRRVFLLGRTDDVGILPSRQCMRHA